MRGAILGGTKRYRLMKVKANMLFLVVWPNVPCMCGIDVVLGPANKLSARGCSTMFVVSDSVRVSLSVISA